MKNEDKDGFFKTLFNELSKEQKEEVKKGNYDPWNFEEEELEDDDYHFEDDDEEEKRRELILFFII